LEEKIFWETQTPSLPPFPLLHLSLSPLTMHAGFFASILLNGALLIAVLMLFPPGSTIGGAVKQSSGNAKSFEAAQPVEPLNPFSEKHWNLTWPRFDPAWRTSRWLVTCSVSKTIDFDSAAILPLSSLIKLEPALRGVSTTKCADNEVQWFVRCPQSCDIDIDQCDWAAAWTRTCGSNRSYIPPVHYGEAPAPELETCLHDHFVITIGDCNVRSLLSIALDALDRNAPSGSLLGAQNVIQLRHHQLLLRESPYGHSRYRMAYRYHKEPTSWNNYLPGREQNLGQVASTLMDAWRPAWDFHGFDRFDRTGRSTVTFLLGGTGTSEEWINDMSAWLNGGCNTSATGCLWHSPRMAKDGSGQNHTYIRPRVIIKSAPAYQTNIAAQISRGATIQEVSAKAGFEWLDAWNITLAFAWFLARDHIHFDAYNTSLPPGWRTGGPVVLAVTNRFLEVLCGKLTDPSPSTELPDRCWHCS
jgi:hypothetical protein